MPGGTPGATDRRINWSLHCCERQWKPIHNTSKSAELAGEYVLGSEDGRFVGLLRDRNDTEIYAGLASGCMADIELLPPYLRSLLSRAL